jgi:hypothetical protein
MPKVYTLPDLFKQLGLASDQAAIDSFIAQHSGVCTHCGLPDAPIWTDIQRSFLHDAVAQDSEWSMISETLTGMLSE